MPFQISVALSWSGFCRPGLAESRKSLRLKAISGFPAYGVILRRYPRLGQRIEESGLADVGQPNDSALKRHDLSFMDQPPCTTEPSTGVVEVPDPRLAPMALISRVFRSNSAVLGPRFAWGK